MAENSKGILILSLRGIYLHQARLNLGRETGIMSTMSTHANPEPHRISKLGNIFYCEHLFLKILFII